MKKPQASLDKGIVEKKQVVFDAGKSAKDLARWQEWLDSLGYGGLVSGASGERLWMTGTVLNSPEARLGFYRFSNLSYRKDALHKACSSLDQFDLCYVVHGKVTVQQHGRTNDFHEGECYLRYCNDPFLIKRSNSYASTAVHLPRRELERWLAHPFDATARPIVPCSDWGRALSASLSAIIINSLDETVICARSLIDQIGCLLAMSVEAETPEKDSYKASLQNRLYFLMREHMEDATLSPEKLAALAKISKRTLFASFAKQGKGFMESLYQMRIESSLFYLNNPLTFRYSVSDIARLVGYTSSNLFIRHFRKAFGLSPTAYRKLRHQ